MVVVTQTINAVLTGVSVTAGHQVSATATVDLGGGNYGDTSEFAQNVTAVSVSFIVSNTNDSGAGSLRQAIIDAKRQWWYRHYYIRYWR